MLLVLLFSCNILLTSAYFADWSLLTRDREPMCVPIPANLSLCHNIGYTKMRLPNLLEHDTMQEVIQQATSWVPLLNIKCHDDTQLFLCSLFAPVCLERPIYPCRSLCQKVKAGCEGTMGTYGFPWPTMLDCDKFPLDNDMCIASQSEKEERESEDGSAKEVLCKSKPCNQAATYENILDNYCQADFVVKMKFRRVKRRALLGRNVNTVFKTWRGTPTELRQLRKPKLKLQASDECCSEWVKERPKQDRYLVMGKKKEDNLIATFILPWSSSEEMKKARRMFKRIDCSNLVQTTQQMMAEAFAPHSLFSRDSSSALGAGSPLESRRSRRTKQQQLSQQGERRRRARHRPESKSRNEELQF